MGEDTKLVVSSEWDYSPFVYRSKIYLPNFVLIGLPAPESPNPLLVPLAGHELGHSVWEKENLSEEYRRKIEKRVLEELTERRWDEYKNLYPYYTKENVKRGGDFIIQDTWINAYTWAQSHIEEIFCDIFGLRLFAESYLYAFAYLISPGTPGLRSLFYPNIRRRVSHLKEASISLFHDSDFPNIDSDFIDSEEPTEPATKLLLSIADDVSASLVEDLIKFVQNFSMGKRIPLRDREKVEFIERGYQQWIVPTSQYETLVDILNAGWICEKNEELWINVPQVRKEDRAHVLRDLILKSMEISEIYERLGNLQ